MGLSQQNSLTNWHINDCNRQKFIYVLAQLCQQQCHLEMYLEEILVWNLCVNFYNLHISENNMLSLIKQYAPIRLKQHAPI